MLHARSQLPATGTCIAKYDVGRRAVIALPSFRKRSDAVETGQVELLKLHAAISSCLSVEAYAPTPRGGKP